VPARTRISGPGMRAGRPASANAAIRIATPASPFGRQVAGRSSSATVSTPFDRAPARAVLSLATASSARVTTAAPGTARAGHSPLVTGSERAATARAQASRRATYAGVGEEGAMMRHGPPFGEWERQWERQRGLRPSRNRSLTHDYESINYY